jgi:predicted nucleic acid-binding protein
MPKLRIYLDTSVISHLFHDDAPLLRDATKEFFANTIATSVHNAFISSVVLDELKRTRDADLRQSFIDAARQYGLEMLPEGDEEVDRLADVYMSRGVIPSAKFEDALHVAFATIYDMDVLATWNFRHLAKARAVQLIGGINQQEGYAKPLRILTPLELLEP